PEGKTEYFETENNPEDSSAGTRKLPFTREIWIEREDFAENPPKGYHRLYIGNEVRLKGAYYITATSFEKDSSGKVTLIHCTYDPQSRGGETPDGRKVKGTSHWVSCSYAVDAEVRLYDKLFSAEYPGGETGNYLDDLNPKSLVVLNGAKIEPSVKDFNPGDYLQFIRSGYFTPDYDSKPDHLVFNRTVTLKDSWAKQLAKTGNL
ncbi:MAG: glutamine--tRNA ligase, partial [Sphaerochaetaceae bacterium]|nr:glutamine--tRNA ligase [Sphaerochaetaceae bacterium]